MALGAAFRSEGSHPSVHDAGRQRTVEGRQACDRVVDPAGQRDAQGRVAEPTLAQALRSALADDLAAIEDQHPAAQQFDLGEDVGRQQQRPLGPEVSDQLPNGDDLPGIETDGGLVEHQHSRTVEDRRGQAHPLAIALGERADDLAAHLAQQATLDRLPHRPPALVAAQPLELAAVAQVLAHPHLGIERHVFRKVAETPACRRSLTQEVAPLQENPATRGWQEAGDHPQGRRLAGPVWTQDADDLAVSDLERHVVDGSEIAEPTAQVLDFDQGSSRSFDWWSRPRNDVGSVFFRHASDPASNPDAGRMQIPGASNRPDRPDRSTRHGRGAFSSIAVRDETDAPERNPPMKSAYELALERLSREGIEPPDQNALDDSTRARIAELRRQGEAKLAEVEILHRDDLKKTADPEAARTLEENYRRERRRIEDGVAGKIAKLRATSGPSGPEGAASG